MTAEVVHLAPSKESGHTRCCGRTPFELPGTDRITNDVDRVTCPCEQPFVDRAGWAHVCSASGGHLGKHRCDTCGVLS